VQATCYQLFRREEGAGSNGTNQLESAKFGEKVRRKARCRCRCGGGEAEEEEKAVPEVALRCGASSSSFFFADAFNLRLAAPPGLGRLKLKDMGLEILSCHTSFNYYSIDVSLTFTPSVENEGGRSVWQCMQGRDKNLNPSALFKGNVFPHVRDVGFFAEHNVQQFLDQGTHTGCTLGAHSVHTVNTGCPVMSKIYTLDTMCAHWVHTWCTL
jgi:hypothetical protein